MKNHSYRYRFARAVPARDIEETLTLALMAVESLHGRARVRMDGRFRLDKDRRICLIDAGTRIGADLAKIFTGYVTREYGEKAVDISRCGMRNTECGMEHGKPNGEGRRASSFRNPHSEIHIRMGAAV